MKAKTIKQLLLTILVLLSFDLKAQTRIPDPFVSIKLSAENSVAYRPFTVSWDCIDPESSFAFFEYRYKLDAPGDWLGGIKYNINKWSNWIEGNSNNIIYNDFIVEGKYTISVQCRNKNTGRTSRIESASFNITWEYPEVVEEAFSINWSKVNIAESEYDKYLILAEEYKNAHVMWNQKFEFELRRLRATVSPTDFYKTIGLALGEEGLLKLVERASTQTAKNLSFILLPKTIYEIIKQGAVDVVLIYRNYEANKASSMAVISYYAWKRFEEKAKNLENENKNLTSKISSENFVFFKNPNIIQKASSEVIINNQLKENPKQLLLNFTINNKDIILIITQSAEIWRGQNRMSLNEPKTITHGQHTVYYGSMKSSGYNVFVTAGAMNMWQVWILLENNVLAIVTGKGNDLDEIQSTLNHLNLSSYVSIFSQRTN